MKIKKYTVEDMQQAIYLIKQELGPEAVIVSSHRVKGPGWMGWFKKMVEVTAVLDDVPLPTSRTLPQPRIPEPVQIEAPKSAPVAYPEKYALVRSQPANGNHPAGGFTKTLRQETRFQPLLDESLLKITEEDLKSQQVLLREKETSLAAVDKDNGWMEKLLEMDIQEGLAGEMLQTALQRVPGDAPDDYVRLALANRTAEMLDAAYSQTEDARVMVFIGQPGVGKTTTITKLATRLQLLQNKKIALITIYNYRYGAADSLKVFAETSELPVEVVMTPAELRQALEKHGDKDYILIDTVGRISKNTGQILELKGFLEMVPGDPDVFLVLSASTKDRDLFRTINEFKITNFNKFIFTKLDETETLGSLLNVVSRTGLPIMYYANGQNIPDDLFRVYPKKLANLLFWSAQDDEGSRT
ncbi:flagellar biosynthesis protein FlhF [Desulforamulus ruminis]|uniref:Flagellar biosynthesis protein FlhF n=1 Tax=Desulforamulus ruminis (strain ATCC 23193 / DSM 2154 / NCIMB 8452 / DL) TaxID=696281 RepID=F6DNT4_DESRL|nr:flagellar biosynthesis protein FlhF [Desulforamulus ruminis]AEG59529.1 flagellar biosynthetic protein FlhF [Desulforamulus ruminis DSM 2154]